MRLMLLTLGCINSQITLTREKLPPAPKVIMYARVTNVPGSWVSMAVLMSAYPLSMTAPQAYRMSRVITRSVLVQPVRDLQRPAAMMIVRRTSAATVVQI